jgi:hypothetical protein
LLLDSLTCPVPTLPAPASQAVIIDCAALPPLVKAPEQQAATASLGLPPPTDFVVPQLGSMTANDPSTPKRVAEAVVLQLGSLSDPTDPPPAKRPASDLYVPATSDISVAPSVADSLVAAQPAPMDCQPGLNPTTQDHLYANMHRQAFPAAPPAVAQLAPPAPAPPMPTLSAPAPAWSLPRPQVQAPSNAFLRGYTIPRRSNPPDDLMARFLGSEPDIGPEDSVSQLGVDPSAEEPLNPMLNFLGLEDTLLTGMLDCWLQCQSLLTLSYHPP